MVSFFELQAPSLAAWPNSANAHPTASKDLWVVGIVDEVVSANTAPEKLPQRQLCGGGGGGGGGGAKFPLQNPTSWDHSKCEQSAPQSSQSTRHFPSCDQAVVQS